ncbi:MULTISPECIES: hypothetical protein [Providencia]|uniref:Uncharacterized protein n=3 Tax=Morganellaceae TaxID=1903414 RepID=A0A379FNV6_PRORE|nr:MULTISPECIES: hypothetical protein [Providencia]ELR5117005.1 hypothetical protein [Providencia rettgeri]MCG5280781.1 hypothetical protein [Providencia rettgeri]MCL0019202.1 hypothetical protein [Providencia rettgeri]MCX9108652.1 hypothetical protein [Providencia rettgeri]MCX9116779.1 hypothetical protein [Providencia rettgeri]
MDDVTHLGTITVWGNNPREHFNDYFNNYDNTHEDIDLTGRYEKLKCILHENLYDNIKLADIHDDVGNHKVDIFKNPSIKIKDDLKSKQTLIENNLITLRKDIAEIEKSPGWKFIIDPQKYPCTYKWHFQSSDSSDLKISATFKFRTIEDRDRLLAEDFDDNIPGIPRFPFDDIDLYIDAVNKRADRDARNQLLEIKKQHKSITDKIQFNVNELNKLKIAQSSMFAIPSPNVPTLPHGVGLNTQVTQTANSNIVKGVEKTLGNIRDGLAETFDCSFGMSCSNDLDKAAKNPNVGTELSDSDRIALGGTGSGSPDGWEPDNNLSTSDRRSIQSLRGQVRLHKEKLAAYRRNPDAFDNQGHLKNAPNNTVRQRIIDGRIKHLEKEIKTFEKNINEIKNGKG